MWGGIKIGDVLAHRYRIVSCIGEGGMGKVFAAEDLKLLDKRWAVKEVRTDLFATEEGKREAELLLKLNHPQLPKITDYYLFTDLGRMYLIMEFVEGKTIRQLTSEAGGMPEDQVLRVGMQLCSIFAYLHALKPEPIIHRDLKPDNVLVDGQSIVHLIDFGISRTFKPDQPYDTVRLGSPGFLAPEQMLGRQSDARTDLYQLGALLFYMLSGGRLPGDEPHPAISSLGMSSGLHDLLRRLLSESAEHRPNSAAEVQSELQCLLYEIEGSRAEQGDEHAPHTQVLNIRRAGYIIVGAPYHGAGATRTATALAEALARSGLSVSLVEYAHQPEHVYRLGGDHEAPEGYIYLSDRLNMTTAETMTNEWTDRGVIHYPLPPDSNAASVSSELWYRALITIRTDAVVIDIGSHWRDHLVQDLLRQADYVVCAIDAQLQKWYRKDVESVLEQLCEQRTARSNVYTIAYSSGSARLPWKAFPMPISLQLMRDTDDKDIAISFEPLLRTWGIQMPYSHLKRRSWTGRLKERIFNIKYTKK